MERSPPSGNPPADDPWVGQTLGDFILLENVASGGMGSVYRGEQISLKRAAAVKIMHPALARDPEMVERFDREAKLSSALDSPHVVKVYAYGVEKKAFYLAMEWIAGESAEELLKRCGRVPGAVALGLMRQALQGLAVAHERKVVHRDLKPSNLLVTKDGTLKITDFGIAVDLEVSQRLTASGVAMGTPLYMPPEQLRSSRVDPRADIYSLGATFYHLVTGRPPFMASTQAELLRKIETATPPAIRTLAPDLPAPLAAVLVRMMDKKAENRYRDAGRALEALQQVVKAQNLREAPVSQMRGGKAAAAPSTARAASVKPILAAASRRGLPGWARPVGIGVLVLAIGVAAWAAVQAFRGEAGGGGGRGGRNVGLSSPLTESLDERLGLRGVLPCAAGFGGAPLGWCAMDHPFLYAGRDSGPAGLKSHRLLLSQEGWSVADLHLFDTAQDGWSEFSARLRSPSAAREIGDRLAQWIQETHGLEDVACEARADAEAGRAETPPYATVEVAWQGMQGQTRWTGEELWVAMPGTILVARAAGYMPRPSSSGPWVDSLKRSLFWGAQAERIGRVAERAERREFLVEEFDLLVRERPLDELKARIEEFDEVRAVYDARSNTDLGQRLDALRSAADDFARTEELARSGRAVQAETALQGLLNRAPRELREAWTARYRALQAQIEMTPESTAPATGPAAAVSWPAVERPEDVPFYVGTARPSAVWRVSEGRAERIVEVPDQVRGLVWHEGRLIVATSQGLWRLREGRLESLARAMNVAGLSRGAEGKIFLNTRDSLFEVQTSDWRLLEWMRPRVPDEFWGGHAFSPDGVLYLACGNRIPCQLWRVKADGTVETAYEDRRTAMMGLAFDEAGRLYFADCGSAIRRVDLRTGHVEVFYELPTTEEQAGAGGLWTSCLAWER